MIKRDYENVIFRMNFRGEWRILLRSQVPPYGILVERERDTGGVRRVVL